MNKIYYVAFFNFSVANIVAIADDTAVVLLQFVLEDSLDKVVTQYRNKFHDNLIIQKNVILSQLEKELIAYFQGSLFNFSVPYRIRSSVSIFQKATWSMVCHIAYGTTQSYKEIAQQLNNPLAMRAIGRANSKNPLMLLIPCHRVIQANKKIGGYAGGFDLKQWLLEHEGKNKNHKI